MKAIHYIVVSSAKTMGAFNTDFDTSNLHGPTWLTRNTAACLSMAAPWDDPPITRGLHSSPFQLNLSSSVHRITQLYA
jgi:hypothetical protein